MACKALEESDMIGRWIYKKELNNFVCSSCQKPSLEDDNFFYLTDYCPNCGILMEKRK